MESTKEVLVRRSNNLLYFPSNLNDNLYKVIPFRNNGISFTKTIDDVHFEGQWDGTENTSGAHGVAHCNITLAAGTYTLSNDENYQGQTIIYKSVDNTWVEVTRCGYGTHIKTFTLTEATVIGRMFWSNQTMDKNVPIDMWMHPMLVEGDAQKDYESYYHEYESTKEVVVRRSNNLFLPFSSYIDTVVGKNAKFSSDNTLFGTIETDGNIHIHGTKSVANSGWYLISNFTSPLVLKAGKTYSFKCNQPYGNCILQSTVSGSRQNVIGNYGSVTPTIDTPITHLYIDMNLIDNDTNIGKEYDFYINPMLVEGDTKQDYEPYYYEAEASKTGIIPDDGSLTSVVDFSNAVKGKRLDPHDGVTLRTNGAYAYVPDYFSCETGEIFKLTYVGQENIQYQYYRQSQIMWYDANKNFLSFEAKQSWSPITFLAAPANAKFFRLNYSGLKSSKNEEWMIPSNPKLTKVTS